MLFIALYWHLLILSPCFHIHLWWWRSAVVLKVLLHDLHNTGFASRCLCWWTCKFHFNVKDFSHWSHAKAFSPVCVNWWTLSECLVVEYLGHLSHGNNFPVSFSIDLLAYMGSFATWQRTMWSFKYALNLKDLSHWLQGYGLSSECIFLCVMMVIWWCSEWFSTVLARQWLFPRMRSCMKFHVMFMFEWFPTFLALERPSW